MRAKSAETMAQSLRRAWPKASTEAETNDQRPPPASRRQPSQPKRAWCSPPQKSRASRPPTVCWPGMHSLRVRGSPRSQEPAPAQRTPGTILRTAGACLPLLPLAVRVADDPAGLPVDGLHPEHSDSGEGIRHLRIIQSARRNAILLDAGAGRTLSVGVPTLTGQNVPWYGAGMAWSHGSVISIPGCSRAARWEQ
jgi:hypothetical protein